jgi:superfamily I DNA/RNA helicase
MTLLTLAADPDDAVAWRCWCGFGSPSLRAGAWSRLTKWADDLGLTVVQALLRLSEMDESPFAHSADLKECYLEAQERLAVLAPLKGEESLDTLAPAGTDWADGLRLLAGEVDPEWGATELRNRMIASATQPEVPTHPDFVRVMSLHKSKGLTARVVVVAGLLDGFVPTSKVFNEKVPAAERERTLRESRRLFYVAVTRATDTLVLSSCALIEAKVAYGMGLSVGKVFKDKQGNLLANTRASQFVAELGPELPAAIRGHELD